MIERSTWHAFANLLGAGALLVGSYLPWARPSGAVIAVVSLDVLPNFHRGIALDTLSADVLLIGAAALAVVALGFTTRHRLQATATVMSGGIAVAVSLQFLLGTVVGFGGTWVPDVGWYLTVGGGFILLANAAHQLRRVTEHPTGEWVGTG